MAVTYSGFRVYPVVDDTNPRRPEIRGFWAQLAVTWDGTAVTADLFPASYWPAVENLIKKGIVSLKYLRMRHDDTVSNYVTAHLYPAYAVDPNMTLRVDEWLLLGQTPYGSTEEVSWAGYLPPLWSGEVERHIVRIAYGSTPTNTKHTYILAYFEVV